MFPKKQLPQNSHAGVGSQALLPAQLGRVCGIDPTGNTSVPPSRFGPALAAWSFRTIQRPDSYRARLSPYSKGLKYRIGRISVEPRLELGEQLAGNGRDVLDARHRQQEPFGPGVEGDL